MNPLIDIASPGSPDYKNLKDVPRFELEQWYEALQKTIATLTFQFGMLEHNGPTLRIRAASFEDLPIPSRLYYWNDQEQDEFCIQLRQVND